MKNKINNIIELKERRKALRKSMQYSEMRLWTCLRMNKLGVKFRRQYSIGVFIVDFYCHEKKLAIEVDGTSHDNIIKSNYDQRRDIFFNELGIKVIHVRAEDLISNLDSIINYIKENLD